MNPKLRTGSLRRLVAGCVALFVVLSAIGLALVRLEASQRSAAADRLTVAEAAEVRAAIGDRLSQNINLARGLRAFVVANPDLGDPARFDNLLEELYAQGDDIRNIGVAPGNVISHVFPIEGNEGALGLRYEDVPEQFATVELAIETRQSVLAGPIDLVQGGRGLIDRTPVFLADGSYWGIVSLVLDVDSLLTGAAADVERFELEWAVRTVENGATPATPVGGDLSLFDDADTVLTMAVPNGSWELAVRSGAPTGGNGLLIAFQVFAVVLAGLVSRLVFERTRDRWRSRMLSLQDDLTGLANRRLLEMRANQACRLAKREGHPISFVYIDLDAFKPVNDAHGHQAGDAALTAISDRMKSRVRESDTIARVGGDEFVILLPATDADGARTLAAELTATIEQPIPFEGCELRVGASCGVATYPQDGDTFDALLAHADSEMYRFKIGIGDGSDGGADQPPPADDAGADRSLTVVGHGAAER
ncbi:MAG: diguanylate cyclase [Ilumatobacteraceae bacterium]|nr:diguanylate cyclase [Ilumatobacteraceae bacterium]